MEFMTAMRALCTAAAASALCAASCADAAVFDVREFGAKGDGAAKDTAAIQAAIDAAERAGGGTVEVPAGVYLTGSIFLKDNIDFHIGAGATLKGSPDKADYNAVDVCPQNGVCPSESSFGAHLILCIEKENVTVRGPGRIDGNSMAFLVDANGCAWPRGQAGIPWRPSQMLYFVESRNVRVTDLSLVDSPYWSCFLHGCTGVCVRGLDVSTRRLPIHTHNGDGIDIDCCQYVTVSDCRISTADDCITLRASGSRLKRQQDCAYVTVANCVLSTPCNAVRVGVGDGRIHDAAFDNIVVYDTRTAIDIVSSWSKSSRGVDIEGLRFSNWRIDCCDFLHFYPNFAKDRIMRDVTFAGVTGKTLIPSLVSGAEGSPLRRIRFRDVELPHGTILRHAEDVEFVGGNFRTVVFTKDEEAAREKFRRRRAGEMWGRPFLTAADIRIRDPFIFPDAKSGLYYLYSSIYAASNCEERVDSFLNTGRGVCAYTSHDLKNWRAASVVLDLPPSLECTAVWAPEMHEYKGKYYIFATLTMGDVVIGKGPGGKDCPKRGTWTFVSESPAGPFRMMKRGSVTPPEWSALDGTLWVENGRPWMVFCHEWTQLGTGDMCAVPLKDDLSDADGVPITLFKASDAPDPKRPCKVTDGPWLFRDKPGGPLAMYWSTDGSSGYSVYRAVSGGGVPGPWGGHEIVFDKNGGHGMVFTDFSGVRRFVMHRPNSPRGEERMVFLELGKDMK